MKEKFLCPISGSEWTFEDHAKIFKDNIRGSNCYSYAMNHPEMNGYRKHKSVPGDISRDVAKIVHKHTDWQSCKDAIKRILDDGATVSNYKKLGNIVEKIPGNIENQMKKKPKVGWRKILLVVDTNDEPKGVPTDFHFYAQNKVMVDKFYNINRVTSLCCNKKLFKNPYNTLNVNAFCSNTHLKRVIRHTSNTSNRNLGTQLLNNRSIFNIRLHIDMLPEYAHSFIIDPWWILNIEYFDRNKKTLNKVYNNLFETINILDLEKERMLKVLNYAYKDCISILKKDMKLVSKHRVIGIWSHKLGWGTKPLNTDGHGKIILNPVLCQRYHGGYDYDKACQAFFVLRGHGFSSV